MSDDRDPGGPPGPEAPAEPPAGIDRGDRLHEFQTAGIRVSWSRRRCNHVAACVMNLPRVFAPGRRPWVDVTQAEADAVARVVTRCPTGALHYIRTDGGATELPPATNTVHVTRGGPLNVHGDLEIFDESGVRRLSDTRVALCRCGRSENPPFCDGAHEIGFRDTGQLPAEVPTRGAELNDAKLRIRPEPGGPLRLTGPVTFLSADRGTTLACNEAALCRCGRSGNRPFCDGTHKTR